VADVGIRLRQLQQDRFDATKAASDQTRTLALAGLAVVWLFAGPYFLGGSKDKPSGWLFAAGALFGATLIVDLIQLVVRATMLDVIYSRREAQVAQKTGSRAVDDPVVNVGTELRWVTLVLFYAKAISLAVGLAFTATFFAILI
jgi:hypothetical protein